MKFGLPISALLHAAAGLVGVVAFARVTPLDDQVNVIQVDIINISDTTDVRASVKTKTPPPNPADTPMTVETSVKNAPEIGDISERTVPIDTPAKPTPTDGGDEPVPVSEAPTKPAFDLDRMADLINKTRDTQEQANQQIADISDTPMPVGSDMSREQIGRGQALTLSEKDALRAAMYRCWRIPLDAQNPEELEVRVRVRLRPDGHVISAELPDRYRINSSPNPYMKIAAQRAVNAVSKCSPYDFLPVSKYETWKDMTLRFKPEV